MLNVELELAGGRRRARRASEPVREGSLSSGWATGAGDKRQTVWARTHREIMSKYARANRKVTVSCCITMEVLDEVEELEKRLSISRSAVVQLLLESGVEVVRKRIEIAERDPNAEIGEGGSPIEIADLGVESKAKVDGRSRRKLAVRLPRVPASAELGSEAGDVVDEETGDPAWAG